MKWTTANLKHPNYTANHEIYVGTQTGSFKRKTSVYVEILVHSHVFFSDLLPASKTPHGQRNISDLKALDKESQVTALSFGNEAQSEILLGRAKHIVEVHSLKGGGELRRDVAFIGAPIVGLARYNDKLIAAIGNGQVQIRELDEDAYKASKPIVITTGTQIDHLRQCAEAKNIVATGGKDQQNNLKVYDMSANGGQVFSSKNMPNDYLQLEVPIWDSDIGFLDGPSVLATCSRTGYVRLYDTRKQRRPVSCFSSEEHGMSFAALMARGNNIYVGTTMGVLKAFDTRRMKTHLHTYKGFTGGISDLHLDASGRFLSSACLDRYVRVHDTDSTVLLYQCYVKSKSTKVLIRQLGDVLHSAEPTKELEQQEVVNNIKQNETIKLTPEDDDYEDMFKQMPTVGCVYFNIFI
ncbi:hypothetical protein KR009_005131 [Drosophila setifemur]|nr:hypothetical protein KR009_005131 [Drosophila setifemur]